MVEKSDVAEMKQLEKDGDFTTIRGGKPLHGKVKVRGSKNFVSKAMVAALLGNGVSVLKNVPKIRDVQIVLELLKMHGCKVSYQEDNGRITIDASSVTQAQISDVETLAGSSRIPILFCGPLLHRLGEAFIPYLGGCSIGDRPIDFHFRALEMFGAEIKKTDNGIYICANNKLQGTKIKLPYPSVGATEQVLLTAVHAEGKTELSNAAIEPEILDQINVLQKMGALITIDTDRVIHVEGVEKLHGYKHKALTDRIETASWACAALATHGDIFVRNADQSQLITFLNVFRKIGGEFDIKTSGIRFYHPGGKLKPISLETDVHPGFATDWQQPLIIALTQAYGMSIVHETVYEQRFGFTKALNRMGAQIQLYKDCLGAKECRFKERNFEHSAAISGPTKLHGANILIPDLRGGFSYIIAALAAEGESKVYGTSLINRGYEFFYDKLSQIGAEFDK
jgi:UDP-N-acetylglucosamine 1-carboxyvinyltransferase